MKSVLITGNSFNIGILNIMSHSDPNLTPETPDILKKLKWLRLYWKKYWLLIVVALVLLVLGILGDPASLIS